jgi:hypothetical protein
MQWLLQHMDEFMRFLTNPTVLTTIMSMVAAGIGYIIARVRTLNNDIKVNRKINAQAQKSQKRSTLRCEYLSVYNSQFLSIEEKYNFTRLIYVNYKRLEGNHYIDELDDKLVSAYLVWKKENKPNEKY